jgi:hypothetical protein
MASNPIVCRLGEFAIKTSAASPPVTTNNPPLNQIHLGSVKFAIASSFLMDQSSKIHHFTNQMTSGASIMAAILIIEFFLLQDVHGDTKCPSDRYDGNPERLIIPIIPA